MLFKKRLESFRAIGPRYAQNNRRFPRTRSLTLMVSVALALGIGCSDDDTISPKEKSPAPPSPGGDGDSTPGSGGTGTGGDDGSGGDSSTGGADAGGAAPGGSAPGGAGGSDDPGFDGEYIFRHDTMGSEAFWTGTLKLHEVIPAAVDPLTALAVGLKVDAEVLPEGILERVDLEDPATTVALLGMDAVVGVKGTVEDGELKSIGITCALCHSDVDDSVMPGIGTRLDGYAACDLNPGAIIALSPAFADNEEIKAVLNSWGAGRYDPYWNLDGINGPVQIPPIYGLAGVELETYTGEGPISFWNAYVAVTQMGAQGNFRDDELGIDIRVADGEEDLVTPRLPALLDYQLSLAAPPPPTGSYDVAAAARGKTLFEGDAGCSDCHSGPHFTDANEGTLHEPAETGSDPLHASRGKTKKYRTTPLRSLWMAAPYFHDGSSQTLADVVDRYDGELSLGLSPDEKADLIEYLKSL